MKRDEIFGGSLVQQGLVVSDEKADELKAGELNADKETSPNYRGDPKPKRRKWYHKVGHLLLDIVYAAVLIVVILGVLYFSGEQSVFIYMRF